MHLHDYNFSLLMWSEKLTILFAVYPILRPIIMRPLDKYRQVLNVYFPLLHFCNTSQPVWTLWSDLRFPHLLQNEDMSL